MLPRDDAPVDPSQFLESESESATCGLLRWFSPVPELNLVLELFLREISGRLFRDVRAVYLYGSGALGDFAPATGDIDVIVAMRRDPGRAAQGEVSLVHRYLASRPFAPWGRMLEASYCSAAALADPKKGGAGLSAKLGSVKAVAKLALGPQQRMFLKETGVLLYGDDLRKTVPAPSRDELLTEAHDLLARAQKLDGDSSDHEIAAAALRLARTLYLLREGRVVSKTEAGKWFASRIGGKPADVVVEAGRLRRGELKSGTGVMKRRWEDFLETAAAELGASGKKEARARR